ncbi:PREDICTED: GBF-interacting 1 [Prunus dulcis]|uniref:PREDICTED: GBF-interacting 1 n=1 Tax=Prunus dulcis TaxID=3755 RepID=A0A5E4GGG3_PRUDU|nr:PREDICTED: GBF-interacting 1 [Prunus dulcis]
MGSETKNGAAAPLSPGMKKMVQSLKEIVNCPEPEIYSVLKDCNMDPNEAVQRLLSLDTFHEVKSKRERRKEMKETQDSKLRVHSSGSNRGVRGSSERNGGWCGSTQTSSNELGQAACKGQNGFVAPSASHFTGGTMSQQPSSHSDSLSTSIGSGDGATSASVQPSPGNQSTSFGTSSGHLSMAEIVKMGRPPSKGSHISSDTSSHQDAFATNLCNCRVESSQTSAFMEPEMHQCMHSQNPSRVSEMIHKPGDTSGQNAFHDEWPVIEQPTAASRSSVSSANVEIHANESNLYINDSNMPRDCQSHKVQVSEGNYSSQNLSSDHNAYAFASSRQKMVDASGGRSYCVDDLSSNSSSYDSHRSAYENGEGTGFGSNVSYPNRSVSNDVAVAVSSATMNMQQLNLGKEEPTENCAVVLPNNLQELAADCSHLSFGTFRSGPSSAFSRSPSNSLKNDLGGFSAGINVSSGRATIDAKCYDLPQPELIKHDILEPTLGHKDICASSLRDFDSENIQRASSGSSFARADPKFRNIPPRQNDMAYSDSMQSDLLESYSQLLVTPSVPSRHSSAISSVNNPTISVSEALRPGSIPLSEASSVLPQHLTSRSYSQPALSYEQLANIMGYPSMTQSYSPAPSTLQQAYLGGSAFQQSVAGMDYNFPQYRSGASVSRLPPSAAAVGGHGNFGASNNVHGSFLQNASAAPISVSDYDDALRARYKDGSHLTPLHQSSRTLSSVPDSVYNTLLRQNQQNAGYRQGQAGQMPSQLQHYGSPGYPDFYPSQMGITQEHHRPSVNDLSLAGIQDLSPQQLHQIWQRTY